MYHIKAKNFEALFNIVKTSPSQNVIVNMFLHHLHLDAYLIMPIISSIMCMLLFYFIPSITGQPYFGVLFLVA